MRMLASVVVALVVLVGSPTLAWASVVEGSHIEFDNGSAGFPGGIFEIYLASSPNVLEFETMCVEITEFINFSTVYAVERFSHMTDQSNKTLGSYAAWLYTEFTNGALNSFNASSDSDANALQLAIWKGVGWTDAQIDTHIGSGWRSSSSSTLTGKTWFSDFTADTAWTNHGVDWTGDVQIMNLRTFDSDGFYTGYAQDQMIRTPPSPPPPVPEPLSVIVWTFLGACVGGLSLHRRRK